MGNIKIKEESFLKRCEICHQSDYFDPITNHCNRCANKSSFLQHKFNEESKSFKTYTLESSFESKPKSYQEEETNNDLQKLSIECFYHPNTSVVGMCKVCQKAICRSCVNKIRSSILLCKDCRDPKDFEELATIITLISIPIFLLIAFIIHEYSK
ncbi:MAG: hypothetical protein HY819_07100 [Acidobacteria bacterium]|nr:hypothetical protein [Acidobacteriota bacterium]